MHAPQEENASCRPAARFLMKLGGLLAAKGIRAWMSTLDYRAVFYDRSVDPVLGVGGPRIYVFWHENILLPLVSARPLPPGDAAEPASATPTSWPASPITWASIACAARRIAAAHGRSGNCPNAAARSISRSRPTARAARAGNWRKGRSIWPRGCNCRSWRWASATTGRGGCNSWDRFAVPRPFSRARAVIGPPLMIPPDFDRAGLEHCRLRVERLLNCLTAEAEAWAAAGTRKAGEVVDHAASTRRIRRSNHRRQSPIDVALLAPRDVRRESTRVAASWYLGARRAHVHATPLPLAV